MKVLSNNLSKYLLIAGVFALSVPQKALAQCTDAGNTIGQGINCAGNSLPADLTGNGGIVTAVINVLLSIVGVVAIIMIIVGALRMVLSSGNEKTVADARNTIIYAVIGLVVAILAFAIVNYVVGKL